jgi:hypothetical protein
LFDITRTGVHNRKKPNDDTLDIKKWTYERNTQSNFDTIIQAISLRSQPDLLSDPKRILLQKDLESIFGFLYNFNEKSYCWEFSFEVMHNSVFDDGKTELGYLYQDCDGVPVTLCNTESIQLTGLLDCSPELRNIYFVKY